MKRPHQKAYAISDMTEEERADIADTIETELKALDGVQYACVDNEFE